MLVWDELDFHIIRKQDTYLERGMFPKPNMLRLWQLSPGLAIQFVDFDSSSRARAGEGSSEHSTLVLVAL